MKKSLLLFALSAFALVSCESVGPKERGVEVSYGGQTNMAQVYSPGMANGFHWMFDDMVKYDVSQATVVEKYEFNDAKNMLTGVEISVDYSLDPAKVNLLHANINNYHIKLEKTIKAAAKEVIPQYAASDLNLTKRGEAEAKIAAILAKELPDFYLLFDRVQLTDVDIPLAISQAAELTAKQAELNKLADSKKTEAENNFHAAEWDAKTKNVLSQPAMLKLKELEIDMEYARRGVSKYGQNNVFGANTGILLNK